MCQEALPDHQFDALPPGDDESPNSFAVIAIVFESSLALAAFGLGWLVGVNPFATIIRDETWTSVAFAVLWGLIATVPLICGLFMIERLPSPRLRNLNELVDELVARLFSETGIVLIAMISLAAGVGEEALFRGLLQAGLDQWIGPPAGVWIALIAASAAFGVCHWLSNTYAVLATIMGAYLGGLFIVSGNLIAPITTHALYDFVALVYFIRRSRSARPGLTATKKNGDSTFAEPPFE